jgi:predicted DCC family thiol-disulfide oxidoreductase YuxK
MNPMIVIYNASCPICSAEVGHYRTAARTCDRPVTFHDVTDSALLARHGLTPDAAARRFHVIRDGEILSGLPAFLVLWGTLPGWRGLARAVGHPVLRPLATLVYDRLAAPLLYALHLRRQRRASSRPL